MRESQLRYIKEHFEGSELLFNEPMNLHTSFKIGGPADLFFCAKHC